MNQIRLELRLQLDVMGHRISCARGKRYVAIIAMIHSESRSHPAFWMESADQFR
jgi:hypothetical protein